MAHSYRTYEDILEHEIEIKSTKFNEDKVRRAKMQRFKKMIKYIIVIAVFFGLTTFVISRFATLNELKYTNFNLKREVASMENLLVEKTLEKESVIALDYIEDIAMNQLGMQYPVPEQTVYLKQTYSYALNTETVDADSDSVVATVEPTIIDRVRSIANRLVANGE